MRRWLCLLFLAGCTPEVPVEEAPADPVVVYAAFVEDTDLVTLFERFEEETGIAVTYRFGEPGAIVDDLIRNEIMPPADVLMTRSVEGAWRAGDEGALRPVYSDSLRASIPGWALDDDELWFATGADSAVILYDPDSAEGAAATSFASLADSALDGRLCLASSRLPINRAVIAMMIAERGTRGAELVVRGWMDNLAAGPFGTSEEVAAAIASGRCVAGILPRSAAERSESLAIHEPVPTIATVEVIGVGRHAHNPDGASKFVEWLIAALPPIATDHTELQDASIAGWHAEDVRKLVERARYF